MANRKPSVAFSTFPFIWHILNEKLAHPQVKPNAGLGALDVYGRIMNGFRSLYGWTDKVLEYIGKLANDITCDESLRRSNLNAESMPRPSWNAWVDLFTRKPRLYLRIVVAIDHTLSHGRLPVETDFPEALKTMHPRRYYCMQLRGPIQREHFPVIPDGVASETPTLLSKARNSLLNEPGDHKQTLDDQGNAIVYDSQSLLFEQLALENTPKDVDVAQLWIDLVSTAA